jgi:hypothetical protein
VWIIEWLPPDEPQTGLELHQWIHSFRPGWSHYVACDTPQKVLAEIAGCTEIAQLEARSPVLHIEAHGDEKGIAGPPSEFIAWGDLVAPLQQLNLATKCNLIVFMAACTGLAAIKTFVAGPRAPAVALVGPEGELTPSDVREAAKEFYRKLSNDASMTEMVASASNESRNAAFDYEPFIDIAYDSFTKLLVTETRPEELVARKAKLVERLRAECGLSHDEATRRADGLPALLSDQLQEQWDTMFMIDLFPQNQDRFGLNVRETIRLILNSRGIAA